MSCKNGKYLIFLIISLGFLSLLFYSSSSRAEPCLRVSKKGVIYYFFSHREFKAERPVVRQTRTSFRRQKIHPRELQPIIQEASGKYGVPSSLIKAVIRVESDFNPEAVSPKGAQGLMQLMPGTAADLQVDNPYNVRENILAGTRYLRMLLEKFNHRLPQALAAYNAGPHRVEKCQTIPPVPETQNYVRRVCLSFLQYQAENPADR